MQTVVAALVERTNANCEARPAAVKPSHSERIANCEARLAAAHSEHISFLAALARTNAKDATPLETNANANRAVRPETVRPSSYSEHITEPVPIRAPLAGTNPNRPTHREVEVPEPVPIRAPLAGTNANRAARHEVVVPLHSERVPTRPFKAPEQSTYAQYV